MQLMEEHRRLLTLKAACLYILSQNLGSKVFLTEASSLSNTKLEHLCLKTSAMMEQ